MALTAALLAWQADIEKAAGIPLLVAKVDYDHSDNSFSLPEETPHREMFARYLAMDDFRREFTSTYAMMVHQRTPGAEAYLVLLNGARESDWGPHLEALLAHEFGHAWVKAQGYATPVFVANQWACVGVHTGDITQHVLIRAEMERRGIEYKKFWFKGTEQYIPDMEKGPLPPADDRCARVRVAAQMVDVRLGLKEGEWAQRERYEAAIQRWMPDVLPTVDEITAYMRQHDMTDRAQHREALQFVFAKLKDLAYQKKKD